MTGGLSDARSKRTHGMKMRFDQLANKSRSVSVGIGRYCRPDSERRLAVGGGGRDGVSIEETHPTDRPTPTCVTQLANVLSKRFCPGGHLSRHWRIQTEYRVCGLEVLE